MYRGLDVIRPMKDDEIITDHRSLGRPLQDGQLMAQGHRRQRERHTLAQRSGQLLK
jgi:hypothetical protein